MKRIALFLFGTIILALAACGQAPEPQSEQSVSGGGGALSQSNGANSGGGGVEILPPPDDPTITLPYSNDYPPSGILDQLAWYGTGGGEIEQPCGSCRAIIDGSILYLSNFKSSQELLLYFYRYTGKDICGHETAEYVTSVITQVDSDGNSTIPLDGSIDKLTVHQVYDANTGEVQILNRPTNMNLSCDVAEKTSDQSKGSCPGAPPQRLSVGGNAYVCTASDTVKLREGAGKKYSIIKSLVPGADLEVIGGPKCSDDWSWWKVKTVSGYTGWMAEGGDSTDQYFLCPK